MPLHTGTIVVIQPYKSFLVRPLVAASSSDDFQSAIFFVNLWITFQCFWSTLWQCKHQHATLAKNEIGSPDLIVLLIVSALMSVVLSGT